MGLCKHLQEKEAHSATELIQHRKGVRSAVVGPTKPLIAAS